MMSTLFGEDNAKAKASLTPLADQLRPTSLDQVKGQEALLGEGGALHAMVKAGRLSSMILWGPPGCGKTTLARLLSKTLAAHWIEISALQTGVQELRQLFDQARHYYNQGRAVILFVDEIHRFNKAQQDIFLHPMEEGVFTLIGATTENPSFELNKAILSRAQVLTLQPLGQEALESLCERFESVAGTALPLTPEARSLMIQMADGDGRFLFNMIELIKDAGAAMDAPTLMQLVQRRSASYDKHQDAHYNLISALHKALRGSDVDAALYWFARMMAGGEDPLYIGRRLVRFASEDVGMADPQALVQINHALMAYERLGSPEGDLALMQGIVYLATAPKSNALYLAHKKVLKDAVQYGSLPPQPHSMNAPTKVMKDLGYGSGYIYDHDTPEGFAGQNHFPNDLMRQTYYKPCGRGFERDVEKRLHYWENLRASKK